MFFATYDINTIDVGTNHYFLTGWGVEGGG